MKLPRVSVIVPNYNHASFLAQRIESILHQTYQDFELILLDDCSTDHSREMLERYRTHPKVTHLMVNEHNSGSPFTQWNRGVQLARGEYIWMAESDDYADPHFLEVLVAPLEKYPRLGLAYCQSYNVDDQGQVLGTWEHHTESLDAQRWRQDYLANGTEELNDYMIFKPVIVNASAVVFRKEAYLQAGMAPEEYKLTGDYLLWAKILSRWDLSYTAQPLNYFRSHAQTTRSGYRQLNTYRHWIWENYRVLEWIFDHVSIQPGNRRKVCDDLAEGWMSGFVLKTMKEAAFWKLYRQARKVDPAMPRRLLTFVVLQLKYKIAHTFAA